MSYKNNLSLAVIAGTLALIGFGGSAKADSLETIDLNNSYCATDGENDVIPIDHTLVDYTIIEAVPGQEPRAFGLNKGTENAVLLAEGSQAIYIPPSHQDSSGADLYITVRTIGGQVISFNTYYLCGYFQTDDLLFKLGKQKNMRFSPGAGNN